MLKTMIKRSETRLLKDQLERVQSMVDNTGDQADTIFGQSPFASLPANALPELMEDLEKTSRDPQFWQNYKEIGSLLF